MSQKFHKTKSFEKLNKQWQKKLAKSGFEDIEQDEHNLKVWSSQFVRKKSLDSYKFKEAYYYMATQFLNDFTFDMNIEKVIWEYHTNGISIRNIAATLSKARVKMSKEQVWTIVSKLKSAMYALYKDADEQI